MFISNRYTSHMCGVKKTKHTNRHSRTLRKEGRDMKGRAVLTLKRVVNGMNSETVAVRGRDLACFCTPGQP